LITHHWVFSTANTFCASVAHL